MSRDPMDYKEGRGDYYLAEGKREEALPRSAAERGPGTAAGRALSKAWRVRNTESPGLEEAWPEQFDRYILAIEAEAGATAAVPLDVERLALALHEERSDRWGGCGSPGEAYDDHMTFHQTRAERIAAEYARLSADEEGRDA